MKRPIGVTLLAIGAGLLALFEIWRTLVFLGIVNWTFLGKEVSFPEAQWGPAIWAIILAAIWIYVAEGFWNVRAYAWSFGDLHQHLHDHLRLLRHHRQRYDDRGRVPFGWLLAIIIFFYLNYPGVRNHFVEHEMSLLTPEQRAAMEQVAAANAAAAAAMAKPAAPAPAPTQTPPPAPPAPPAS